MNRRPFLAIAIGVGLATAAVFGGAISRAQTAPSVLRSDPVSFRDVVKATMPAVVSIEAKAHVGRSGRLRTQRPVDDSDVPDNFRKFFEDLERRQNDSSGPSIEQKIGFGSGFIVDAKGIVVTNNHVIENAEMVEITLADGRKFSSKDIKGDQRTDLAIVRFDPRGTTLPALEFGDSNQMEVGDRVLAIGAPFELSGTVTHGIISSKNRDLRLNHYDDFIQTDAAINPGNSGGPLINLEGKVIGITSAIKSNTGRFQGVSMAISSNMAKNVFNSLVRDGVVKRPYIGIEAALNTTPDVLAQYGAPNGGVIIGKVRERSPALKGGLKADDTIVAINGKAIHDIRELQRTIANQSVGVTIDVDVVRDGKTLTLKVKLEQEPENYVGNLGQPKNRKITVDDEGVTVKKAGLELADLTATQAEQRGITQKGAAVIKSVAFGSIAQQAGLSPGLVIVKVNKKPVTSAADAKEAIEETISGDGALLHVQDNQATAIVKLKAKE